ncbi:MAG: B12-binding domain-containing radical SAM protein [Nanoarchaeota archaeon]|nr:B12-binding domain-containing radical SAM protein [Nanoarchaeota archaeon]
MEISLISTSTYPSDQGLRSVSSVLKSKGYKVKLIFLVESEDYNKIYSKNVLNQLRRIVRNSDVVGISSYASTAKRAEQVIRSLKNKLIVYGGVHATICPHECINVCDHVCVGEGEEAFLEFVEKLKNKKDYSKVKNFWFRKDDEIIRNEVRPLIQDLDKLPFADYDIKYHYILEKNKIIKFEERHLGGGIFFLTGRGCPYSCTYCSNRLFNDLYKGKGKILRWHSPDYIIDCILDLKRKYKSLKIFDIRDDTFFARNLENIREFCEKYKKKVNLRFKCLGDPVKISDEKIKLLVDAGCTDIIIGIQGSENVNYNIYKRYQKDEEVVNASKILSKYKNLAVMYDVITCNPYENKDDVLNLIKLLIKVEKPYYLSVNNLVFFTGTELYNKAKEDKIIIREKDSAANLNYWDRWEHIKLKKKNAYLNLVLNLMRGVCTRKRYGIIPFFVLKYLIKKEVVDYNLRNEFITYSVGNIVGVYDYFRENLLKKIYRSLPVSFKVWYDKVRYRV